MFEHQQTIIDENFTSESSRPKTEYRNSKRPILLVLSYIPVIIYGVWMISLDGAPIYFYCLRLCMTGCEVKSAIQPYWSGGTGMLI